MSNLTAAIAISADRIAELQREVDRLTSLLSEAEARGRIAIKLVTEVADQLDVLVDGEPLSSALAGRIRVFTDDYRARTKEPAALRAQTDGGGNG